MLSLEFNMQINNQKFVSVVGYGEIITVGT